MSTKKGSLASASYEYLKERILSYSILPGDTVSDYQIAAELGVSRAPVREAIMMLSADGLVETGETGKTVVTHIRLSDIIDILHVRRAVETEAVRIIAENGWLSEAQERELTEVFNSLAATTSGESVSIQENYRLDDLFHKTITGFSGNNRIMQIVAQMTIQMQRARWLNIAAPTRMGRSFDEHKAIYDAVISKDEQRAIHSTAVHLKNSETSFANLLTNHDMKQIMTGIYSLFNR